LADTSNVLVTLKFLSQLSELGWGAIARIAPPDYAPGAHTAGLPDRILLNYTRVENAHKVHKLSNFCYV